MHHDQIQIFDKIMHADKRISVPSRAVKVGIDLASQIVRFDLSCSEQDPVFSKYESTFFAHLRYPFMQCGFSLDCKETRKAQRPLCTVTFDFSTDKWKLCVYDRNDYAVDRENFSAESPDVLFKILGYHWHIENLHEFIVDFEGPSQMNLPLKEE